MELPENPDSADQNNNGQSTTTVQIGAVHLQVNDLDALRRLAETHPDLAKSVVDQKDQFDRREHVSYRIALVVTALLAFGLLGTISAALFSLGLVKGIILIALILSMGLVLRVVLTGEWSDTSWVGQALDKISGLKKSTPEESD